ncbi:nucleotide exchange factor GrpE [Schlesneria paludicola]|uniref:nucleotide exchange factor GrpE n=1 Tax=Schlesneria paludicola TaxID=360056 RepID=UPI00029AE69F|nr:nucleotide exchange factor GrpE [Schlesneria paludicola]
MNDATFPWEFNREPRDGNAPRRDDPSLDDSPQFGAVDIVEAFTAMRHEWRGQTKESRAVAEQIQTAVTNIQSLEAKLHARAFDIRANDNGAGDTVEARPLVLALIETDHQLSRAVSAVAQWDTNRRLRAEADAKAVERYFAGMNRLARWLARPLLTFVMEQQSVPASPAENPAITGLDLVLGRLRRVLNEHGIERIETEGQAFDADTMYAIGTAVTTDYPSGHVAEQLSPAYRWQGRIVRFADVRVTK